MSNDEVSLFEVEDAQMRMRLEAIRNIQGDMGWRWFIAEILSEIEVIDQALRTCSTEELGRLQGRRDSFEQIVHFEDTVEAMLAQPEEETPDASV